MSNPTLKTVNDLFPQSVMTTVFCHEIALICYQATEHVSEPQDEIPIDQIDQGELRHSIAEFARNTGTKCTDEELDQGALNSLQAFETLNEILREPIYTGPTDPACMQDGQENLRKTFHHWKHILTQLAHLRGRIPLDERTFTPIGSPESYGFRYKSWISFVDHYSQLGLSQTEAYLQLVQQRVQTLVAIHGELILNHSGAYHLYRNETGLLYIERIVS